MWFMGVTDVVEEVDFVFWKEEGDRHRVDWCITPSLSKGRGGTVSIILSTRTCLDDVRVAGSPRRKIRRSPRENPRKQCTLRLSRSPYPRFPCYSKLPGVSDWRTRLPGRVHPQWQPLYLVPPSSEMNSIELFGARYSGCSLMNSTIITSGSGF